MGREREKAAGMELEQFFVKSPYTLLLLEGVDEDAEDADATIRDELIMLACDDPIWKEVRRYLQKKKKKREQMQKRIRRRKGLGRLLLVITITRQTDYRGTRTAGR
ncbi:hypothetical protein AX15_007019 [Amanita polypyramis BW_CC]|nr:hypothetical protein AX15_007019 [Amanita polypyramis BW_CC]